jgi:hypothetical protein
MFADTTPQIQILLRQSKRYYDASLQDQNKGIASLHINYSVGILDALREAFSDMDILKATGVNILGFRNQAIKRQDEIQSQILKLCPSL